MAKMYKFTTRFKNSVKEIMSKTALVEIRTKRQKKNTLLFKDLETNSIYGFYESGYCRRLVPINIHWGTSQTINGQNYQMYQLNKRRPNEYSVERIKANPLEQLGLVITAIYRERKKYNC